MKKIIFGLFALLMMASCAPKNITYMRGFENNQLADVRPAVYLTAQPQDKLTIYVSSKDPALAEIFNLMSTNRTIGSGSSASTGVRSGGTGSSLSYTVNSEGYIDFPVLGPVKVEGMTRQEIAEMFQRRLVSERLLTDAIVTVEFTNATVTVLGDVGGPGEYRIENDQMTIWQAIARAGDLSITGMRTNVLVVREENGKDRAYRLDLTDTEGTMQSPAYYLRQNDIVYVEPNNMKKRSANVNGNNVLSVPFWMSAISFLSSMTLLVINLTK